MWCCLKRGVLEPPLFFDGVSIIPDRLTSFPAYDTTVAVRCRGVTNLSRPGIYQVKGVGGTRGGPFGDFVIVQMVPETGRIRRIRLLPKKGSSVLHDKDLNVYSIQLSNQNEVFHQEGDCDIFCDFLSPEPYHMKIGEHVYLS